MQCIVILLAILLASSGVAVAASIGVVVADSSGVVAADSSGVVAADSSGVAVADSSAAVSNWCNISVPCRSNISVPWSNISSNCINSSDYLRIESSLLSRPQNLVNLYQAFFPTNRQASISVQVTYHFTGNPDETVTYRWLDSSVLMLIRSDLLHYLSLFTYNVKTNHANITLDPICGFSSDDNVNTSDSGPSDYCKLTNSTGHHLLNSLTANLFSYALHRNSVIYNGIDSTIESGYSVYVFNTENLGDYCIFDEYKNFRILRKLLFITFGLLELTSMVSIPLLLGSIYGEFKKKMSSTDKNGNENKLRYFVWATLVLIVLIIPLLLFCNFKAIHYGLSSPQTKYKDILVGFTGLNVLMFVLPVVDLLAAIVVVVILYRNNREINCFGFPDFVNTELICIRLKNVVHVGPIFFVMWFTQFALFNSIYVFIGAIVAPVETGSLLLLYITSLFALISFFAVILKVFHNILPVVAAAQPNNQREAVKITCCQGCSGFTCFVPFVVLVGVLASGIGVFVTFMYLYITLNQEYRNNRGILTFLGALLPSLLASTSGYFWTRIMPCIGKRNKEPLTDTEIREKMISMETYLRRIANSVNPN